jgi:virginiamycin B lyase
MVLVLGLAGSAWGQALPEGKGKDVVEAACTACHGTSNFTGSRFSRKDWEFVVSDMIDRGALITPEEKAIIVDYLVEHFGPEERPKGESTAGK